MTTHDKELISTRHDNGHDSGGNATRRLQIIAAAIGLAVLLAGAAQWVQRDADPAPQAAARPNTAALPEPPAVDYFPAQYTNQATEPSEHIQAF